MMGIGSRTNVAAHSHRFKPDQHLQQIRGKETRGSLTVSRLIKLRRCVIIGTYGGVVSVAKYVHKLLASFRSFVADDPVLTRLLSNSMSSVDPTLFTPDGPGYSENTSLV